MSSIRYFTGVELIAEERARQISEEGWTSEHDDEHVNGELAEAAAVYADASVHIGEGQNLDILHDQIVDGEHWPFEPEWLRLTSDPIDSLIKAGALIAAEIDRRKRLSVKMTLQPAAPADK